jgi:hypothetical protein
MDKPLDKKVRYGTEFENEDLKNYIDELWQYTDFLEMKQSEKLTLYSVVRSFLNKESESLGVNVEDLYINLCEDELTLHKEDIDSYYFNLHIEKIIE